MTAAADAGGIVVVGVVTAMDRRDAARHDNGEDHTAHHARW
jgi:hypothetical protein